MTLGEKEEKTCVFHANSVVQSEMSEKFNFDQSKREKKKVFQFSNNFFSKCT